MTDPERIRMLRLVRIREARIADADAIARVYVDAWRTTYPGLIPDRVLVHMSQRQQALEWAQALARRRLRESVLVAEVGGQEVIGFGSCGPTREPSLPQAAEIYTLYVRPDHHDRGVGRQLLLRLFGALVDRRMHSANVWVLAGNPARFFYEAMGGRRVAERNEALWNATLRQTAYAWDDLRALHRRRPGPSA